MTPSQHGALLDELARLRTQRVPSSYGQIPASVARLEDLIRAAGTREELALLYSLLFSECSKAKNDALYLSALQRGVEQFPNSPQFQVDFAFGLALVGHNRGDEALASATHAIELAKTQDRMVRYSATALLRIALALDNYDAVNRALAELVADEGGVRSEDTGFEFDFVDRIDPNRADPSLLRSYRALNQPR